MIGKSRQERRLQLWGHTGIIPGLSEQEPGAEERLVGIRAFAAEINAGLDDESRPKILVFVLVSVTKYYILVKLMGFYTPAPTARLDMQISFVILGIAASRRV